MAVPQLKRASAKKPPFLNHGELKRAPKSPQQTFLRVKQQLAKQELTADKHPPLRPRGSKLAKSKAPLVRVQARQERRTGKPVGKKSPWSKSPWVKSPWTKPQRQRTAAARPPAEAWEQADADELHDVTGQEPAEARGEVRGAPELEPAPDTAVARLSQQQPMPRQQANTGNNQVVFADVSYAEQADRAYMQVSVLEEVWEVNWVHPIQACWKQEWWELHPQIVMDVQEARYEDKGRVVWVRGEFELTAFGTTGEAGKVAHETLRLPFTSTVLRPPVAQEKAEASLLLDSSPLSLPEKWIETGDWKVSLMSEPFMKHGASVRDYKGVTIVSGRIWWFRKQLVPLRGLGQV
ncbi:hypothetical protein BAG01nite_05350 [Brevibacillus agri]|uniref:Uncharacterized protein n=1 Tax=Brevibacillus agri TaxID=51101 RepID=A0A3M8BC83_9BACL|nr:MULTISPECIES: hypothetical protein [Brevibacillus]QAV14019.1 hypothetical protein BA6348_15365 [Brevibacillus agri]QHZ56647.1 hypothetical protein M655_013880 [Brevibacillus sp. NSP2.1]RNB60893.1 hypothetical protein EB820_01845 [Brevibacillus agri]GED24433.1 hypothetical protein BAG01nite_05350 [Brevibacillus agri]